MDFDAAGAVADDVRCDEDEGLHGGLNAVGHEVELAFWRREADAAIDFELVEADTTVELDVVEIDHLASDWFAAALEVQSVVETHCDLWLAAEFDVHLDGTDDFGVKWFAVLISEKIDGFANIDKDLIFCVFDSGLAELIGAVNSGDAGGERIDVEFVGILQKGETEDFVLLNEVFENFGFRELRITEIGHFVQEFVNNDEVITDTFFGDAVEVVLENVDRRTKEGKEKERHRVDFGNSDEVDVVVADVAVDETAVFENGADTFFVVENAAHENLRDVLVNITTISSTNNWTTSRIEDVNTRSHFFEFLSFIF